MKATAFIDGAARGNPGPAAFAYVLRLENSEEIREKAHLGRATNNVAEYTALVRALQRACELGVDVIEVNSDSNLLVQQMKGTYRVKSPGLRDLYQQADGMRRRFRSFTIRHVPRAMNAEADRLCNEALDETEENNKLGSDQVPDEVKRQAITYLEQAARAWSSGDPKAPRAVEIWNGLCAILRQHGLLP
jgi:ribonuclease HI